jgi:hypothetical protein
VNEQPVEAKSLVEGVAGGSFKSAQGGVRKQESSLSKSRQVVFYLGVVLGVILSPTVTTLLSGGKLAFTTPLAIEIIISLVIGLLVMPQAYEKLKLEPKAPFVVQFGLFLQSGVFWQVALNLLGKASGSG